jgi:Fe2+ or Zn2+ uptake regulation protein
MEFSDQLRSQGRRVTRQRLEILAAVEGSPHATAEEITALVRNVLPEISLQSVYSVLTDLTGLGMLRKFEAPGSAGRYETRVGDNHHHAVCSGCGRIEDVECSVGHAPCLTPADSHGMTIEIAEVLYRGICADCRNAAAEADH